MNLSAVIRGAVAAAAPATLAAPTARKPPPAASVAAAAVANGCGIEAIRAHLLELAEADLIPVSIVHALPDADVNACMGESDATLTAYLRALDGQERMDNGLTPLDWGEPVAVTCDGCGPVLLWATCPPKVKACPWCFRRKAGKPYPKACTHCGGGPGSHRCVQCYPRDNLPRLSGLVTLVDRTSERLPGT